MYKRLYIWVEGDDDENFTGSVLKPSFDSRYDFVYIIQYAQETNDYISNFIKSINQMGADYIFLGDINSSPCVTEKKNKFLKNSNLLQNDKINIVIKEIESWFLAGLTKDESKHLGLKHFQYTNDVTKEEFDNIIKDKFDSRINVMAEILSHFSIDTAKNKNNSFRYFADKYNIN